MFDVGERNTPARSLFAFAAPEPPYPHTYISEMLGTPRRKLPLPRRPAYARREMMGQAHATPPAFTSGPPGPLGVGQGRLSSSMGKYHAFLNPSIYRASRDAHLSPPVWPSPFQPTWRLSPDTALQPPFYRDQEHDTTFQYFEQCGFQSITAAVGYPNESFEELRLYDYGWGRQFGSDAMLFACW